MRSRLWWVLCLSFSVAACRDSASSGTDTERVLASATTEFLDAVATSTVDPDTGVISTIVEDRAQEAVLFTMQWDPGHRSATWEHAGAALSGQLAADDPRLDAPPTPAQANSIAYEQWAGTHAYHHSDACDCVEIGEVCAGINVCWWEQQCDLKCDVTPDGSVCDFVCVDDLVCEWVWECWWECVAWDCVI